MMKKRIKIIITAMLLVLIQHTIFAQSRQTYHNTNNKMKVVSFNKYQSNPSIDRGFWKANRSTHEICIDITDGENRAVAGYSIENCYLENEFEGFSGASDQFQMKRLAGTLVFKRNKAEANFGTFTFEKDAQFVQSEIPQIAP